MANSTPTQAGTCTARLHAAAAGWATVSGQWGWVRTPDAARATPETTSASAALHVAIVATTRTVATWTSPLDVVQRLDGVPLLPLVRTIVEDSAELADTYQQLPRELHDAGRLRAPAGILRQMTIEHTDQTRWGRPAAEVDDLTPRPPVRLIDVASKRLQPLTPLALNRLSHAGALLMSTAQQAQQALHATAPPRPSQRGTGQATPQPPPAPRHPQHHPPRPAPGLGITP